MTTPRVGWPFAVGLVLVPQVSVSPEDAGGLAEWPRLTLALAAYKAGFYLVDVVEVTSRGGITAKDWARLWSLARRVDADAVFVLGPEAADREVLDPMADELRLVVRVVQAAPEVPAAGDLAGDARSGRGGEGFAP